MAASSVLHTRKYEMLNTVKWFARKQHTDEMTLSGITEKRYAALDDRKFSILWTQKLYFAL